MDKDSYVFFSSIFMSVIILKLFLFSINSKNNFASIISLISIVYILIHANRYGAIGNDYIAHFGGILSILYLIDHKNNKEQNKIALIISFLFISILSKISLFFIIIFFIPLFIQKNNFLKLKK